MRYFLWRLLGRCFWIKLNSHYRTNEGMFYSRWEQKKDVTKNHDYYKYLKTLRGPIEYKTS